MCATGGRIDHMLANLSLLEEAKTLGGHLTILDPYNRVELHQGGRQEFIMPETFTYFSVVPMDAVLEGVTIENAKYELTNGTGYPCRHDLYLERGKTEQPLCRHD